MITKDLFDKFLQNECTEEECKGIEKYLAEHPAELERLMPENEFATNNRNNEIAPDAEQRIQRFVKKNTFGKSPVKQIRKWTIAASLILLVGIGIKLCLFHNGNTLVKRGKTKEDTTWQTVSAYETAKQIVLPDSSIIKLAANSTLRYSNYFGVTNTRIVYLSGEALFKVKKDKTKPFSVVTNNISTTALGTSFTVFAYEKQDVISILLHTGKVVIRSVDPVHKKLSHDMYLAPGEELFYNRKTYVASILSPPKKVAAATGKKRAQTNAVYKPDWYQFGDQPLSEALDQLSFYYQKNIVYNEKDISRCYITATFSNKDSLPSILHDIALLNDLTVGEKDGVFFIHK